MMNDQMPDGELAEIWCKNKNEEDRNAGAVLISRHGEKLLLYCKYIARNSSCDAYDIYIETWIRAGGKICSFKKDDNFLAWLKAIARFIALECFYKNKNNSSLVNIDDFEEVLGASSFNSQVEDKINLRLVLSMISEEDRNLIILRDIEGKSYSEIASILQKQESVLRVQHHRALRRLRAIISNLFKGQQFYGILID